MELNEERKSFYILAATALTNWSVTEAALGNIFIVASSSLNKKMPEIYWSVINFEARLEMTHAAMGHFKESLPKIYSQWNKVYDEIKKSTKFRNTLAHGAIVLLPYDKPERCVLVPYYGKSHYSLSDEYIKKHSYKFKAEYTLSDVRRKNREWENLLASALGIFSELVREIELDKNQKESYLF